ncbi:nicotinate-nucleotide--dimethylbenzimidazole phosphoribosyltransferase [Roseiflexus castenholzii]|uniref:Nicotinate-nucleotide--dimethylbenzimidazole phosphoribosyltransferase n=1 Tax=Roseiflexus castenholzii (strain DSM 13941 / HLO8) TaxID=383372 RepID=COBT_ROSCS|nr:nicotinate-nucleotide--dimethylbenzimidazole phosphoribosyltransferase [Roseiflexus castenholzii]A7NH25.1 RecName: Full=Nicotinate-nucleotide--dimethylbenzimidazole phosphoribosyltransferase; Short=NN:DBI PRT; AltName: Full=N(1)-alpha-phosphoribosyltransferase [Roseiflexus castenholzii DSM 13941]ABU56772.1 Nicotinate-nucleotide--dimethylbenzimidazole phosphoribosyltransferase [Roseiflexus castenholzii DSM 13941]
MSLLTDTITRIGSLDSAAATAAQARQDVLTKPQGALGRLETLSVQIAGITGQTRPRLNNPAVIVMAADHGVARRGVSAYPSEVTSQMVLNFLNGGAAINVLARHIGARVIVVDIGVAANLPSHSELIDRKLGMGTADFSVEPAMSRAQAQQAVEIGIACAYDAIASGVDLLATGDMGIGNTTASSAVVAAITGRPVAEVTGRGAGIDDAGLARKIAVIEQALALHHPDPRDALDVLTKVGGFEIGGLAGVILGAAARRVPVVIDGFISGAAALIACTLAPSAQPFLIAALRSVERGHDAVFAHLDLTPLFDLGMRLGEGTGAVLGMSLCQAACKILDEMATFGEAGVSGKVEG